MCFVPYLVVLEFACSLCGHHYGLPKMLSLFKHGWIREFIFKTLIFVVASELEKVLRSAESFDEERGFSVSFYVSFPILGVFRICLHLVWPPLWPS